MDYNLLKKQEELMKEKKTKKEKQFLFQILLNKENITKEEICAYGEILEEIEEKN